MRIHFLLYLFLLVLLASCSSTKQFYQPPHRNGTSNYDTSFKANDYFLKLLHYNGVQYVDLSVQDIFQKSLFSNLVLKYPLLRVFPKGNNRVDIAIDYLTGREFSYDYATRLKEAIKIKPDSIVAYRGYLPRHFDFFYVLPKSSAGNFVFREIDIDKNISRRSRQSFFLSVKEGSDSVQQVFHLPLSDTSYPFQPGGFLVGIPYPIIDDLSGPTYHPENRFVILNSHVLNYERNVQLFFFHFFYSKSKFKVKHFYEQRGFNQFIDSINILGYKGINPYTRFVAKEQLNASLEEFMHLILYAEYGCREKPVFVKMAGEYIYRFKFYSEVKHSNMIVDFDLRKIKIFPVKVEI